MIIICFFPIILPGSESKTNTSGSGSYRIWIHNTAWKTDLECLVDTPAEHEELDSGGEVVELLKELGHHLGPVMAASGIPGSWQTTMTRGERTGWDP